MMKVKFELAQNRTNLKIRYMKESADIEAKKRRKKVENEKEIIEAKLSATLETLKAKREDALAKANTE